LVEGDQTAYEVTGEGLDRNGKANAKRLMEKRRRI